MKRKNNWDKLLNEWVEIALKTPFQYGEFDCALMAADGVEVITGVDVAPELRGTYYTPLGAWRVMEAHGGLEGLCDHLLGSDKRISNNFIQRGDVLLIQVERLFTLGVCLGNSALVMAEKPTTQLIKNLNIKTSWRI